ncbi:MAG TPA: HAD family hydrolase, partial [Mycobacterium sp.]|nr:HAD family hydrolase [Mycobacterium sp.]
DADLGVRVSSAGYLIVRGQRWVEHPVGPAGVWKSVALQAGNADDAMMASIYGFDWRRTALAGPGRTFSHFATVASGVLATVMALSGRRSGAKLAATAWVATTGRFAWRRLAPGPWNGTEIVKMAVTSAAIPVAAVLHRSRGVVRSRRLLWDPARAPLGRTGPFPSPHRHIGSLQLPPSTQPAKAVLFDRDGTLVVDRPYNHDADATALMPGARQAISRLRDSGFLVGVVTNQSGIGRGLLTSSQVAAVNERVDALLGGLDVWRVCPHAPEDGCVCRKPQAGLIKEAASRLGVDAGDCVVVGDIGSDIAAAAKAGARSVLVPTSQTKTAEIAAAPTVCRTLLEAVDVIIGSVR